MVKKGVIWHTDTDMALESQIKKDKETWEEVEKLAVETTKIDFDGNALPAVSLKASGRNCPRCSNRLRNKEMTDNNVLVLICWNCHSEWHSTDLEAVWETDENGKESIDSVTDGMFRRIPDREVLMWMDFFERKKKK